MLHFGICWSCWGACGVPRFLRAESDSVQQEVCRFTDHPQGRLRPSRMHRYQRGRIIRDFLHQRFGRKHINIELLTILDIRRFVTHYPDGCNAGAAHIAGVTLRSYLRFRTMQYNDRVEALIAAVPNVAGWRLAALPETLSDAAIEQFLNSFDRETAASLRDYAMVRCLADLGCGLRKSCNPTRRFKLARRHAANPTHQIAEGLHHSGCRSRQVMLIAALYPVRPECNATSRAVLSGITHLLTFH